MDLEIKVVDIKGTCATHKKGDRFILHEGFQLVAKKPICLHGLASIMPFYNALRYVPASKFGLDSKDHSHAAYIQCPDACEYTGGGTAVFKIEPIV